MGIWEIFLIGVGLSMDAFAVSVCKGLNMPKLNLKHGFIIALFFGGFQALMPFLGWALGKRFEKYITAFDHWIAFILLAFIGIKMIIESFKGDENEAESDSVFSIKELFVLAVATSIDALAAGITFAFLSVNIVEAISLIGLTTFTFSLVGIIIGHKFGSWFESKAELLGGAILVLIGLKILLEHLGVISL